MREHPVVSADIIRPLFPRDLVLAVRHHHERYDGDGYPDGLAGEAIPPLARAMAVVDAYDAMSCRRPYKAGAHLHGVPRGAPAAAAAASSTPRWWTRSCTCSRTSRGGAQRRTRSPRRRRRASAARPTRRCSPSTTRTPTRTARSSRSLREVRDANPPTRFLTTHAQVDKRFVIGVDPEEDGPRSRTSGDEIFVDDELTQVLAGKRPQVNTVFADEFGVWVTGLAPITRRDGRYRRRRRRRPARPLGHRRANRCAATADRPSPRCCRRRPSASAGPRSTRSPTRSPASTTTATCTSA